jgi:hypothetical protein
MAPTEAPRSAAAPVPDGVLAGIRVLNLSRILSGPLATKILAGPGADVVKVEDTKDGNDTRQWGPPFQATEAASRAGAFWSRPPAQPTSRRSPGPQRPATRSWPADRSTAPRHCGSALPPSVSSNPDSTTPRPLSSARSPLGPRRPSGRETPVRRTAAPCGDRPHTFTSGPAVGHDSMPAGLSTCLARVSNTD